MPSSFSPSYQQRAVGHFPPHQQNHRFDVETARASPLVTRSFSLTNCSMVGLTRHGTIAGTAAYTYRPRRRDILCWCNDTSQGRTILEMLRARVLMNRAQRGYTSSHSSVLDNSDCSPTPFYSPYSQFYQSPKPPHEFKPTTLPSSVHPRPELENSVPLL
jgi:hypothetical protein